MSALRVAVIASVAICVMAVGEVASPKSRLRLSAIPDRVLPGRSITLKITGTRARRCTLTLRADRFRAVPYLRRRVAQHSTFVMPRSSTPGSRILAVRCAKRRAFTRLVVSEPGEELGIGGEESPDDPDPPPDDETPPPDDEAPPPDDEAPPPDDQAPPHEDAAPPEEPPTEVPPPEADPPTGGDAPDTQSPSTPTDVRKTGSSSSTISVSWRASKDNVAVKGYSAYRGSTRVANVTSTSYKFTGLGCGKRYTLAVSAYDSAGNTSAKASLAASTSACPPPPKKVTLKKGASAQGRPGCSSSACRYLEVSYSGFGSGSHSVTCRASGGDEGGFYSYKRSGTSDTSAVCYYGLPGRSVWVTVDGTSSNKVTW